MDIIAAVIICLAGMTIGMGIYRLGIKDGLDIGRAGRILKSKQKQVSPSVDPMTEGMQNILSYNGETQKKSNS